MAICGTCGSEALKTRTIFEVNGQKLPEPKDECPNCAPDHFERFQDPSEKKIWMSWEKDAAHYRREYDKDGPIMMPSDSVLQDLQDSVCKPSGEELQAGAAAIEEKRSNRRTTPMSSDEVLMAINKAREIAFDIEAYHAQAERESRLAREISQSVN